jgi:hypothetical protein
MLNAPIWMLMILLPRVLEVNYFYLLLFSTAEMAGKKILSIKMGWVKILNAGIAPCIA